MNESIQQLFCDKDINTINNLIHILEQHKTNISKNNDVKTCKTCFVELTPDNHRQKRRVCYKCIYMKESKYHSDYSKKYYVEKIKPTLKAF